MDAMAKLIRERHSAREPFDRRRPPPRAALLQILEAARWAPTAHNMQNFEVVVVDDAADIDLLGQIPAEPTPEFLRENYRQLSFSEDELRHKKVGLLASAFPPAWRTPQPTAAELARDRAHPSLHDSIGDSPLLLVVVYDPSRRAPASEGDFLGVMSLGCVLQNMWLTAESLGIGFQVLSSFAGAIAARSVKELLMIPEPCQIAFAVRLGYPVSPRQGLRVRRDLRGFVHHNRFGRRELG